MSNKRRLVKKTVGICQWCEINPEFKNDLCRDCFNQNELNRDHEAEMKARQEFEEEMGFN